MPRTRAQRFFASDRDAGPVSDIAHALIPSGLKYDRLVGLTTRTIVTASLPKKHTRLFGATGNPPGFSIKLLVPTDWCWWRRMYYTFQQATEPRTSGPRPLPLQLRAACFLRIHAYQHFQSLAMPSPWFAKALPTDGASHSL